MHVLLYKLDRLSALRVEDSRLVDDGEDDYSVCCRLCKS